MPRKLTIRRIHRAWQDREAEREKEKTMEIKLHDGKNNVLLRGNDGTFELCWEKNIKDKATGRVHKTFVAEKWYASIPSAIDALMKLKISNADVSTLLELQEAIKRFRKELLAVYE